MINIINKSGSVMGKYSYPLYISHYTVLFVFSRLIHNVFVYALVSLPVIALIAYGLENWLQPAVMGYFKKPVQQQPILKEHDLHQPALQIAPAKNA